MKIYKVKVLLFAVFALTACDYLDFDESTGEPKEYWYSYFNTSRQLVNYHYSKLYQDFGNVGNATLDCASDDAEYVYSNSAIQAFNDGSWSAINVRDTRWDISYNAIRSINDFLKTYAETDFSRFQYNQNYEEELFKNESLPYEARLLRALYLFDLAKRYGDIPMPLTVLSVEEANSIEPTPFDDVIDFIVEECDATAQELPWVYTTDIGETGRVTKGVAIALKSRVLLYAASKLHNPNNDISKWEAAAKAAFELISDVDNPYSLEGDINKDITNIVESQSPELIMIRRNSDSNYFEKNNYSIGFEGGNTGICPSQNLVDAFQTNNGYDVSLTESGWDSDDPSFDETNPYVDRDPRFYKAVLYNGAVYKNRPMEIYEGGMDGLPIQGASLTGYYLKKYLIENLDLSPGIDQKDKHHWIIFRYAEILMNYAEAMNEAYSPDFTNSELTMSATTALNMIRQRAQMPLVSGLSQEEFKAAIVQERRVEFAFEGMRFWDIRRWMIGNNTQQNLYGARVVRDISGNDQYELKLVENRVWDEKMNLYPIPQQERFINPNLDQNSGW